MRSLSSLPRPFLLRGTVVAGAALAGYVLHCYHVVGIVKTAIPHPASAAAQAAPAPALHPAVRLIAPPASAPAGFVTRSAHYTLTAEIHAGS